MTDIPGFFTAFAAGFLSFLSPCVLPLVPSYLAMLAGSTVAELRAATDGDSDGKKMSDGRPTLRLKILAKSIAFILGFSTIFIVLGVVLSRASAMIGGVSRMWNIAAGILVIVFGVNIAFDLTNIFNIELRFHSSKRPQGLIASFLFGAAFAAGWSPCVGPILASILLLAGKGSSFQASILLSAYSLGLAVPFLLAGVFFGRVESLLTMFKKHMKVVKIISGMLLVVIGISMISGNLRGFSSIATRLGYAFEELTNVHPIATRIFFSALYGAIAALIAFVSIRPRKKDPRKKWKLAVAGLFAIGAILEGFGLLGTGQIVSGWLSFQGI